MRTTAILAFTALAGHAFGQPRSKHSSYELPEAASSDLPTAYNQLQDLIAHANAVTRARAGQGIPGSGCTPDKIRVRRKWEALSREERIAYRRAVECMHKLPAKSPSSWAPGAKTRSDDFVATHIDQAANVHSSGTFLAFHRWIIAENERVLREECGYKGTQPYLDFALTAMTGLEGSPLFDGSETSMGGNGPYVPRTEPLYYPRFNDAPGGDLIKPTGTGGGCIKEGPFSDYVLNMGPHQLPLGGPDVLAPSPSNRLAYNPRCFSRDLSDEINTRWVNGTKIVNTILRPQTNLDFRTMLDGQDSLEAFGVHGEGHMMVGGDPGGDFGGNAIAEPVFYVLHSAVDMYWWIWQTLDWDRRVFGDNAISETVTGMNDPPSANATFETVLHLHNAGRNATIAEVISTVDGKLCYVYE